MAQPLKRHPSLPMTHPGVLLMREVLQPENITPSRLSDAMGLSRASVSRVTTGKSAISADFAQRLELALGVSAEFWVRMQGAYDLWKARQDAPEVKPLRPRELA